MIISSSLSLLNTAAVFSFAIYNGASSNAILLGTVSSISAGIILKSFTYIDKSSFLLGEARGEIKLNFLI